MSKDAKVFKKKLTGSFSKRLQTAEGWKRSQLKKHKSSKNESKS